MKTAAVVIAAGLPKCEGVPAAMYRVGSVSSAQHMIASFQKAGVSPVFLVVDEKSRKLEKQLSSNGVLFLRFEGSVLDCAKNALSLLSGIYERLFVCTADRPLILPETIKKMLSSTAELVVPCHRAREGQMFLLKRAAAEALSAGGTGRSLAAAVSALGFDKDCVETADAGLHCTPKKAAENEAGLEAHQDALMRPLLEISVSAELPVFDRRLMSLLRQVQVVKSVRAACALTGMSYSIAWNLLNTAEERLGYALVTRNQGGRSGSGTELTEKGGSILRAYNGFESAINEKMAALYEECFGSII